MHFYMRASLALRPFNEFCSYSEFKSLSVIGRCPVNINIVASKTEDALHMIPKTKWQSSLRLLSLAS
jgi:hypothetical protein